MDVSTIDISARRQITVRQVMRVLFEQGPTPRAEIARLTGLSKQAVSEAVDLLEASGIMAPGRITEGSVGRRPQEYNIVPDAAFALAFDVGGTKIEGVLIDLTGKVVERARAQTPRAGGQEVVQQIATLGRVLCAQVGSELSKVKTAVVGVPGVPDPDTGVVRLASNIDAWGSLDVRSAFADGLGCPVHLENDVNLAAIGELYFGAGQRFSDFGFLNLGTGIGLGLIVNGALIRGATGAAGEIGFLPIVSASGFYHQVREGQLERAIGSHGILSRYNAIGSRPVANVGEVFARAAEGDPKAVVVINDVASLLATALLCVKAVIDIREFVLGGSIGLQDYLINKIEEALLTRGATEIRLSKSQLENTAGSRGAAYLAVRHLAEGLFNFSAAGDAVPNFSLNFDQAAPGH